jgi:hypothetical protein
VYGRDFLDFVRHMQAQGVTLLDVTADHVKLYKRALLEAGRRGGQLNLFDAASASAPRDSAHRHTTSAGMSFSSR